MAIVAKGFLDTPLANQIKNMNAVDPISLLQLSPFIPAEPCFWKNHTYMFPFYFLHWSFISNSLQARSTPTSMKVLLPNNWKDESALTLQNGHSQQLSWGTPALEHCWPLTHTHSPGMPSTSLAAASQALLPSSPQPPSVSILQSLALVSHHSVLTIFLGEPIHLHDFKYHC